MHAPVNFDEKYFVSPQNVSALFFYFLCHMHLLNGWTMDVFLPTLQLAHSHIEDIITPFQKILMSAGQKSITLQTVGP